MATDYASKSEPQLLEILRSHVVILERSGKIPHVKVNGQWEPGTERAKVPVGLPVCHATACCERAGTNKRTGKAFQQVSSTKHCALSAPFTTCPLHRKTPEHVSYGAYLATIMRSAKATDFIVGALGAITPPMLCVDIDIPKMKDETGKWVKKYKGKKAREWSKNILDKFVMPSVVSLTK